MAIKELFNDARPQVLFDPRASQRIDPRFKFTRNGAASYYDSDGVLQVMAAPANQPRIEYDPVTKAVSGLLLEPSRTNYQLHSNSFSTNWPLVGTGTLYPNSALAPDGTFTASKLAAESGAYLRGPTHAPSIGNTAVQYNISNGTFVSGVVGAPTAHGAIDVGNGWYRVYMTASGLTISVYAKAAELSRIWIQSYVQSFYIQSSDGSAGNTTNGILIWGAQVEIGSFPTSYIHTTTSTVTRPPDLLTIEAPLPATGSIYIDARSLGSNVDETLLSAAPASPSTDKLALAIRQPASLFNSKALVYEVDGAFKPTLPFPVPSTAQERNLITYGANNYHYRSDSARYTPSSSTSVPANMTRLGIGHDVTDPTKAMSGYINAVYLWPGEITPTVAEALVRGDVDPKNADSGTFTPEAGALAFVFNTQGTATDGDRVVQLPVRGSTNNILVDWGDNTSSSFIGAAASSTVSHTYSSAGIYPVQITADDDGTNSGLQNLYFFDNTQRNDLVRVLQWGGTSTYTPTDFYFAFANCTQMDFENGARINLPDTSAVTNWGYAFFGCTSITGQFPAFDTSGATALNHAWYNCSGVTSYPQLNTSNVTNFDSAWYGNSSLTSFPSIDTSNGLYFGSPSGASGTWGGCSGLTSFPLLDFSSAISLEGAWIGCSGLTSFPAINTASVTRFGTGNQGAWQGCTGLTSFPLLDTSNATHLTKAWSGCSSLTSFPNINTSNCTDFFNAWNNCSSLTSFPALDFSSATGSLGGVTGNDGTWRNCSSLTSFPFIDTSGINGSIAGAWAGCSGLTSFPLLDFANVTAFGAANQGAWQGCTGLTSFPSINTGSGTNFYSAWASCTSLTSFPSINTSNATVLSRAWYGCSGLTSFPLIDTSQVTDMWGTWQSCTGLTSFPLIDTSNVVYLSDLYAGAWLGCSGLTSFPQLDLSSVQWVGRISNAGAWSYCSGLTSFPQISFSSGLYFYIGWYYCTSLADFPAGCFSSTPGTDFTSAFTGCALTAASIENILGDLVTANSSSGIKVLGINAGTNAGYSTWSATAQGYLTTLQSRGWTVSYNP